MNSISFNIRIVKQFILHNTFNVHTPDIIYNLYYILFTYTYTLSTYILNISYVLKVN